MLVTYNGFKIDLLYDILQVEYIALEENVQNAYHYDAFSAILKKEKLQTELLIQDSNMII